MSLRAKVVRASTRSSAGKRGQLAQHANAPRVPFALLVTGLIVGGLALLLLLNTASAANELHRHDLAAGDASIAAQVQELQNEVAESAAPANLAAAAAALGMVPAGNPAFLVIEADGSVRLLGHPAPASAAYVAQAVHKSEAATKATKATKAAQASKTAKKTAGPAGGSKTPTGSRSGARSGAKTGSPSAGGPGRGSSSHAPQPTPTPTLTLPGGNR